jgi:hypothetical protein
MDDSLPLDDPELSEGVRLVNLASMNAIELQSLGSDLGILAGPPGNSYARMAMSGPGVSLSESQSWILGWTLWRPRRACVGPCMYALSQRPLSVIYSDSESFADIAAKQCSKVNGSRDVLDTRNGGVRDEEAVIRTLVLTACHVDHILEQPSNRRQPSRLRGCIQMQHVYHDCAESVHLDQCDGLASAMNQTTVRDRRGLTVGWQGSFTPPSCTKLGMGQHHVAGLAELMIGHGIWLPSTLLARDPSIDQTATRDSLRVPTLRCGSVYQS